MGFSLRWLPIFLYLTPPLRVLHHTYITPHIALTEAYGPRFDGGSFVGGMFLVTGLALFGNFAYLIYQYRQKRYQLLEEEGAAEEEVVDLTPATSTGSLLGRSD